jgi:diacylglycerol O-acyltransferase / trehalose O-mycolyltransferase
MSRSNHAVQGRLGRWRRPATALTVAALIGLVSTAPTGSQEPATGDIEPAESCEDAGVPFDEQDLRLTGRWSADDGGVYYIRQVGDQIWWNGMSGREGPSKDLGRDFDNVAHGTLKGVVLGLEFADVPRGNVHGHGRLSIRAEADDAGELRLRRVSGDFGGTIFTPCEPEPVRVDGFARPYSFKIPFGTAANFWRGVTDHNALFSPDIPGAGLSAWALGPGWSSHCSMQGDLPALASGADGLVEYLRTHPGLEVGEESSLRLDGRRAVSVDIRTTPEASGCDGDQYIRIWKESDHEAGIDRGATTRIVALDVDGLTVAFEIWSTNLELWAPSAERIIETVRFDTDANLGEAIGETADDGARVVKVDVLDERTRDLTIESPSVGYAMVRLLLPDGFDDGGQDDWPVLYLLHGAFDDYTSWTRETDVEELEELSDVLVVMPTAGTFGWYSDWWFDGAGGIPAWETFHIDELRQLVERNWQAGDRRVVAGLSMGGFGAMSYAARHPGLFGAAASYSGVMDTVGSDFQADAAMWGDKTDEADVWTSHNPTSIADQLEGTPLYVSWGNGSPGPLDQEGWSDDGLESWVAPQNEAFVARLEELGIDAEVDDYGDGLHTWPYWERGLHESLPMLREGLELGRR